MVTLRTRSQVVSGASAAAVRAPCHLMGDMAAGMRWILLGVAVVVGDKTRHTTQGVGAGDDGREKH